MLRPRRRPAREGTRYCPACGRALDEEDSYCPCMNRIEEPEAEVSRLKSVVEWQRATIEQRDERIAELIGERDSLMDQCHGLQRLADERDGLRMRAATLEKHLSGFVEANNLI